MVFRLLSLTLLCTTSFAAPPEGYLLKWSDEFIGKHLDTEKWNYRTDSKHWSSQRPENVELANGKLFLKLKKESHRDQDYTGAGLISKSTFQYGYYEARIRMPPGAGWHTAFWTMFHDGEGGTFGKDRMQEIDIVEQDSVRPRTYYHNVHDWKGKQMNFGRKVIKTKDLSERFHTWGCEFTADRVRFFFEGELMDEVDATAFQHGPMHIWLTCIASHLGNTKAVDDTQLPSAAIFDYVRFYEKVKIDP